MYRKTPTKNGFRYWKDNRFISKDKIPQEELDKLDEVPTPMGGCLFCGVPAKLTRFVNMQTIVLCEKHYYDTNVGQIAQKLNNSNQYGT